MHSIKGVKLFHTYTCNSHMVAMEGIRQAICNHGVLQWGVTHLHPCSHVQRVRSLSRQRKHN